jgi:PGM1 C-terminal domain
VSAAAPPDELERFRIPLPEPVLQERFEALQRELVGQWRLIESFSPEPRTIVVVPSLSGVDLPLDSTKQQAYEERFLFLLFLLRQPRVELVYVTSQPILPTVVDYYLGLLPGVVASHARRRLHLFSPYDGGPLPLSAKLLERPRLLEQIRAIAGDAIHAHLVPFNATVLERDLTLRLGIPMYAADPRHSTLGTKTGSRALFAEAGITHPAGREGIRGAGDLVDALVDLLRERPGLERVVVKHDEGVSGFGNAVLDVSGLDAGDRGAVEQRLEALQPEAASLTPEGFLERLSDGGIVEEMIVAPELRSPSVQMRATPLGEVELLSTHDQLLGGATGQTFLGSIFPASSEYAGTIAGEALAVGRALASRGVIGRFAVDFLCARSDGGWQPYAIELNLRKGGTTHPYLTLQFLTDGAYDGEHACFSTPSGQPKYFVSTDRLDNPAYRILTPDDVFELAAFERLHFDHATETGVVFHMLTALGRHGMVGITAVENTPEAAAVLYERTREVLDRGAEAAGVHDDAL